MFVDRSIDPTADQVRALRDMPEERPITMVNLLKFRAHPVLGWRRCAVLGPRGVQPLQESVCRDGGRREPGTPEMFGEAERVLVEQKPFIITAWRYPGGVCALRLENDQGNLVMMPFQGQQIWSAEFSGRNLTMKSMFSAPRPTRNYLENYGGFLLHCGVTAMGVPAGPDTHPLHGELPNAPLFQKAFIELGEDETGGYIALGGQYQHTVAFSDNYLAEPLIKLYAGSSLFKIILTVSNLKKTQDVRFLVGKDPEGAHRR